MAVIHLLPAEESEAQKEPNWPYVIPMIIPGLVLRSPSSSAKGQS